MSGLKRYLMYFSYIGTHFRGLQKQYLNNDKSSLDPDTIQGSLEIALKLLEPANELLTVSSSRTDKGVHALRTTAHVDLAHKAEGYYYCPDQITKFLNKNFVRSTKEIRIQKTVIVPETFSARYSAIGREYLYRLAFIKPNIEVPTEAEKEALLPATELHRCFLVRPALHGDPYDVAEKLKEAASLLVGTKDFATFMCQDRQNKDIPTVRTLDSIIVTPGRPLFDVSYDPLYQNIEFVDIKFKGRSFLYKQVRKTVGAFVAYVQNRITLNDIQYMLDNPHVQNWNNRSPIAPPYGLYLLNVEYDKSAFTNELPAIASGEEKVFEPHSNDCDNIRRQEI